MIVQYLLSGPRRTFAFAFAFGVVLARLLLCCYGRTKCLFVLANMLPHKSLHPPKRIAISISIAMISRRDKLLQQPWEQLRYAQHREKVMSARPAIDTKSPRQHDHVQRKWKKQQNERERQQQIERENLRLLQKLGDIMRSKRMNNLWLEPRPNFLNREKMFPTRPYSSLPQIVTIYGVPPPGPLLYGMVPKTNVMGRCPTCSGNPERTQVAIPEQRMPWALPRKSSSRKHQELELQQRCYQCGGVRSMERKLFDDFDFDYE